MRKLLPENWGFLCPVHTPDGGPCGLLNHLAANCTVVALPLSEESFAAAAAGSRGGEDDGAAQPRPLSAILSNLLVSLGMVPHAALGTVLPASQMPVLLDGRVIGGATPHVAYRISRALRLVKARTTAIAAQPQAGSPTAASTAQALAVNELLRAALQGLTLPESTARRLADSAPPREGGVILPPALEVAFIPPPWWDADVDPHLSGAAVLERGMAAGMFAVAPKADAAEEGDEDDAPAAGAAAGQTKLTGLFAGLFLHTTAARLVRPVIQVRPSKGTLAAALRLL